MSFTLPEETIYILATISGSAKTFSSVVWAGSITRFLFWKESGLVEKKEGKKNQDRLVEMMAGEAIREGGWEPIGAIFQGANKGE